MPLKPVPKICAARLHVFLLALGIFFFSHIGTQAGVVTNLTQTNLMVALTNGGPVTFLTDGTLTVTSTIPILTNTIIDGVGHNVIISGGGSTNAAGLTNAVGVRIFFVTNGVTLTLRNISVIRGNSTNGGGIYNAGGTVNMVNCLLGANLALGKLPVHGRDGGSGDDGGDGGNGSVGIGGGIYNLGNVSINRCIIQGNGALGSNGGNGGDGGDDFSFGGNGGDGGNGGMALGGAIYNLGTVSITNSIFTANFAGGGGGGAPGAGGIASFSGKPGDGGAGAGGHGGGIYNRGTVTINNTAFVTNLVSGGSAAPAGLLKDGGNGSVGFGGGIYNLGTVTITNSTFSENASMGGHGGDVLDGIFEGGDGGAARGGAIYSSNSLVLVNCTIATNNAIGGEGGFSPTAANDGNRGVSQGGNIYRLAGQVQMRNTILAKGTNGSNYAGTVIDHGYNLSSDATPVFTAGSGSQKNINVRLGPLANNGGTNLTMALLRGSPAIDAGDPNFCLPTDQRGVARPQGIRCDIGAFEREPAFDISGVITDGTNKVSGVTVFALGSSMTNGAISATNGTFAISNLVLGTYTVTAGPSYTPSNYVVTVSGDVTNRNFNFVGAKLAFPGYITNLNGLFGFVVTTKPSQSFQVQSSTNLIDWNDFSPVTNVADGSYTVGRSNAAVSPQLFFRLRLP